MTSLYCRGKQRGRDVPDTSSLGCVGFCVLESGRQPTGGKHYPAKFVGDSRRQEARKLSLPLPSLEHASGRSEMETPNTKGGLWSVTRFGASLLVVVVLCARLHPRDDVQQATPNPTGDKIMWILRSQNGKRKPLRMAYSFLFSVDQSVVVAISHHRRSILFGYCLCLYFFLSS